MSHDFVWCHFQISQIPHSSIVDKSPKTLNINSKCHTFQSDWDYYLKFLATPSLNITWIPISLLSTTGSAIFFWSFASKAYLYSLLLISTNFKQYRLYLASDFINLLNKMPQQETTWDKHTTLNPLCLVNYLYCKKSH